MEYEKIKELINVMDNSKLNSLEIEFPDGIKISMEKYDSVSNNTNKVQSQNEVQTEIINTNLVPNKETENSNIVKSPMVGTFYLKSAPNAEPFVELGQNVNKGDILCIVEAMKLMNEIESEYAGKISKIYVKDGECVEYGQPLFEIINN